ncbi:type VI secretion protein IcmF/TssM N-terminal domain-containing protein [Acinetobacter baumannii]
MRKKFTRSYSGFNRTFRSGFVPVYLVFSKMDLIAGFYRIFRIL